MQPEAICSLQQNSQVRGFLACTQLKVDATRISISYTEQTLLVRVCQDCPMQLKGAPMQLRKNSAHRNERLVKGDLSASGNYHLQI